MPSLVMPEKRCSVRGLGIGWYAFHVGKGATYSTLVLWLRPLRGARQRHHFAAQQSPVEPSAQDGTR